jgi:hypothetical protein
MRPDAPFHVFVRCTTIRGPARKRTTCHHYLVCSPRPTMPNKTLLSAEQAAERLRNIVEKFFSWSLKAEDGKTISRLLVKSPPGLGKTREAMDWATQYQTDREQGTRKFGGRRVGELMDLKGRFALFVPRHALATEIKSVIEDGYQKLGRSMPISGWNGRVTASPVSLPALISTASKTTASFSTRRRY